MLLTVIYLMVTLLLLILVHESGHFVVARLCGVKVLRFSFGFGTALARWQDKRGTEYTWSLFPLGGYVKMLDETDATISADEHHLAFNNQSVWVRIAIVVAGPLSNFLFAFILLWLSLVIGIKSLAPMIDQVKPASIAANAGLQPKEEIIALNDQSIQSWRDFQYGLMPFLGTSDTLLLTVRQLNNKTIRRVKLMLENWQIDPQKPDLLASLGLVPFVPKIPPMVGKVLHQSPAQLAGILSGDRIESVDGNRIDDWLELVSYVKKHAEKPIKIQLQRQHQSRSIVVLPGSIVVNGKLEGYLGMHSQPVNWPADWLRWQHESPWGAVHLALKQTLDFTHATFRIFSRLVLGKLSLQTVSGPLGIAQGAGDSARIGLVYYLVFLALLSISLGVLNLLPIPMLDGGHLLFMLIEIIKRRPLSEEVKSVATYLGLGLLMLMMLLGLVNDMNRLFG
ncbi:MAG: RIP metalloprotease RseP [Legionella sp.]